MDNDPAVRENRLGLLRALAELVLPIADLRKIQPQAGRRSDGREGAGGKGGADGRRRSAADRGGGVAGGIGPGGRRAARRGWPE